MYCAIHIKNLHYTFILKIWKGIHCKKKTTQTDNVFCQSVLVIFILAEICTRLYVNLTLPFVHESFHANQRFKKDNM